MKKALTFITIMLLCIAVQAQKTPNIGATRPPDSLKARRIKGNKIQEAAGVKMGSNNDIFENLRGNDNFTALVKALRASGLPITFKSHGPLTLFAPTNDAFNKLPKGKVDTLIKKAHELDMIALLTGHAVPGKLTLSEIKDQITDAKGKAKFITLGGNQIFATLEGERIVIMDEMGNKSMIEAGDFLQHNGLIHVINNVLVPKPRVL